MARRFQGADSTETLAQDTILNEDMIQTRHSVGTDDDSDKGTPLSVIQSCPVAVCETTGSTVAKVATVDNFPDFTLLNGREVLVYFANSNTATSPTLNVNNTGAYAIALENQDSDVTVGTGAWGDGVFLHLKFVSITVDSTTIEKWIIVGSNIAQKTSDYTIYADGRTVYESTDIISTGSEKPIVSDAIAFISASSTTITGNDLASGTHLKILFTSAITGSDTTTGLTITYNGTAYNVMVGSQGSLANMVASLVDSTYYYLQAYTTLDLMFDGTQFIVVGNPVVYSSDDYTIYADGSSDYPLKSEDVTLIFSDYTWEQRGDWYRANVIISDVTEHTILFIAQTHWSGSIVVISQLDYYAENIQLISSQDLSSSSNPCTIRLFYKI